MNAVCQMVTEEWLTTTVLSVNRGLVLAPFRPLRYQYLLNFGFS